MCVHRMPGMCGITRKTQDGTAGSRLTQFLSEETERELALFMGMVLLGKCEEVWVFGERVTDGMAAEIAKAEKRKMKVRYFTDGMEERK